jgi:hypothetical protein
LRSLYTVDDPGIELGPQLQLPPSEAPREPPHQERHPGAGRRQGSEGDEGEQWVEDVEEQEGESGDNRRHEDRRDHTQVDVLQLVDVFDDAGEQISRAVAMEAGGREGFNAGVEPGPEVREQPEGQVVGDHALGVACAGPRDAEEADEVDRDDQSGQKRHERRRRDHVRRGGEQPDVARHGRDA